MKLALDAWYEAWGRTEDGDAARAAKHGEATTGASEAPRDRTVRHGPKVVGEADPPACAGP